MTDAQQDSDERETTGTGAVVDAPQIIEATGPSGVVEPAVEKREFKNNVEAFDAKQAESLAQQAAPNPTTDAELAREAYGEDWNRRRGHKLIATASEDVPTGEGDTEALYDHGGSVVDGSGHVLGHTTALGQAVAAKRQLGTDGELGRYPVTAEAQAQELRDFNEAGKAGDASKTLDGGLGAAVDGREQDKHDEQVVEAKGEGASPKPAAAKKATPSKN